MDSFKGCQGFKFSWTGWVCSDLEHWQTALFPLLDAKSSKEMIQDHQEGETMSLKTVPQVWHWAPSLSQRGFDCWLKNRDNILAKYYCLGNEKCCDCFWIPKGWQSTTRMQEDWLPCHVWHQEESWPKSMVCSRMLCDRSLKEFVFSSIAHCLSGGSIELSGYSSCRHSECMLQCFRKGEVLMWSRPRIWAE